LPVLPERALPLEFPGLPGLLGHVLPPELLECVLPDAPSVMAMNSGPLSDERAEVAAHFS